MADGQCWLCEGLGGVAVHLMWTERRGMTLLTPHEYPSDDDHKTWPCPACELQKLLDEREA